MDDIKVERFLYNRRIVYTNCIVEIYEDKETGERSVGWYWTDETEETIYE